MDRPTGRRPDPNATEALDDRHVASYEPIPTPAELRAELPTTDDHGEVVRRGRRVVAAAMRGDDDRMVVIVGPCSIHDPDGALEYAQRLRVLRDELDDQLVVVMRTYFEKPRTSIGWKGLIYDPSLDGSSDAARGLITGGPVATPALQSLLWAAAIAVVFAPLSVRALKRRV
jgi:3-deoxy-7-phosphoheptulonate synthase